MTEARGSVQEYTIPVTALKTYDAAYVEAILLQERRRRELPSPTPICPQRRELIEEIELEEPDPAIYHRLCQAEDDPEKEEEQTDGKET